VLELVESHADVVGCHARPAALDRLAEGREQTIRAAPDELLLLGERHRCESLDAELRALDPGGLVLDVSSSYAVWSLRGDERLEAFGRLSAIPLPAAPAEVQGLVAHVPAKVLVSSDELLVLVSSVVSHHLAARVRTACADLVSAEERVLV